MIMGELDGYTFRGKCGPQGELTCATIGYRERLLVSLTSDMRELVNFDGLSAINITGELVQLIGIYYHGDLYPMSRKTLMDLIARMVHAFVSPARSSRKNIASIRYIPPTDGRPGYIREKSDNLFIVGDTVKVGISLRANIMGSDFNLLYAQAHDIATALQAAPGCGVSYHTKGRLVGKANVAPLLSS